MVYHVPIGKSWNTACVAESLTRYGLESHIQGDRISVRLPVIEFDLDKILSSEDASEIRPKLVGHTTASLTYSQRDLLENLHLDYDTDILKSATAPDVSNVRLALLDCGYVCDNERQIALMYCPGDERIASFFDRLDELQLVKEELVSHQQFDKAKAILDDQRAIRQQVADIVRSTIQ